MSVQLLFGLLFLVLAGAVGIAALYGWVSSRRPQQLDAAERAELESLRELRDNLRSTAYDHRELDSALASIFIDEIKSHDQRQRGIGR